MSVSAGSVPPAPYASPLAFMQARYLQTMQFPPLALAHALLKPWLPFCKRPPFASQHLCTCSSASNLSDPQSDNALACSCARPAAFATAAVQAPMRRHGPALTRSPTSSRQVMLVLDMYPQPLSFFAKEPYYKVDIATLWELARACCWY